MRSGRPEGPCPLPVVDNFPTFHTVFHNRVENSYFSTTHNRVYSRVKIPNY